MENNNFKKYDTVTAIFFSLLSLIFLALAFFNKDFFNWAYERHQNQISWYIRPLWLVPFCFFSYKRSLSGIMATIFCILTSMFWFPKPDTVSDQVKEFLQFEIDWLGSSLNFSKLFMLALVPISLTSLAIAFWKRSLKIGLSVIAFMAIGKMLWSVAFSGDAGKSIFLPALLGLLLCSILIYWGFRKLDKKQYR
jgi:hypothetical protein